MQQLILSLTIKSNKLVKKNQEKHQQMLHERQINSKSTTGWSPSAAVQEKGLSSPARCLQGSLTRFWSSDENQGLISKATLSTWVDGKRLFWVHEGRKYLFDSKSRSDKTDSNMQFMNADSQLGREDAKMSLSFIFWHALCTVNGRQTTINWQRCKKLHGFYLYPKHCVTNS